MVKPERRTRADLLAAAAIAVVVAVVAALIWWTSDARATISRPAASPVKTLAPAKVVPRVAAGAVDGAEPEDDDAGTGRRQRGDRKRPRRRRPRSGDRVGAVELRPRPRPVRGHLGVQLRGRRLSRQPGLRPGDHHRRADRYARTEPHRLRRSRDRAVLRRHHGARGRRQQARAVALRHGPDDQPRRAGRPDQTRRTRPGAVPTGIRGGQHGRGGGARGVPGPARRAADGVASRQGGGHPRPQVRAAARRQGGLRRARGRRLRDHHRRLRARAEAVADDHRRNRIDDGQPAAAQAAVAGGRRNPPR